jgi:predicted transporter
VTILYACPMCFSAAADSPMVDAALIGIVALFAITVGVLGGFAAFIRHVARLSRQAAGEGNVRLEPDATEDR